jgi:hypothetical protein
LIARSLSVCRRVASVKTEHGTVIRTFRRNILNNFFL